MIMNSAEAVIKDELTVKVGDHEYTFKIPSVRDRLRIAARAVQLRSESNPQGQVVSLGYDPSIVGYTEILATFTTLIKATDAPWVYSPDANGQPTIDIDKWPDNVPFMEVVDQFNKELDAFRKPTS
jgi:hypothetical protein